MRRPETPETIYLDFDGFFASVEQQARPRLRGRPVGVIPFEGTDRTCVIAVSREAKAAGVRSVMNVSEARSLCPDIVLVPQSPDLYRRAHNALMAEIESVIPIDAVKSIDELACTLDPAGRRDPLSVVRRLKVGLAQNIGPYITCSVGIAANRQLAKIAGEVEKPDGSTLWRPEDLPGPLFRIPLNDIPGIGERMAKRLELAGISTTEDLYRAAPKRLRAIWGSVTGERLWYALHGYDVHAPESQRGMFGHGRVLPPESRSLDGAFVICRLLLIKAARRLRRGDFYCSGLWLWLSVRGGEWSGRRSLPIVHDDQAMLAGLDTLWRKVEQAYPKGVTVFRVGVTLFDLTPAGERQLDFLLNDDAGRQRWERVSGAIDGLNARYGRTVVSLGEWSPPAGGHVGGKIAYTRIPTSEDFW